MSKKLLSIQYKINYGIAEGGTVVSQTNLNAIKDILGADRVDVYGVNVLQLLQKIGFPKF